MIDSLHRVQKLANFPRKAHIFFGGFKFDQKYFSTNYGQEMKNIRATYPEAKECDIYSVKMKVFSNSFSIDHFGNDCIRMHSIVFRTIFAHLGVIPVGYHLYFDVRSKSIKSQFFFINFDKLTKKKAFINNISKQLAKTLTSKIKEKIGNFNSISLAPPKKDQQEVSEILPLNSETTTETQRDIPVCISELIALFGDSELRTALDRGLKGLPLPKARKLVTGLNNLLRLDGDKSIQNFSVPKKLIKSEPKTTTGDLINARESENFMVFLGLDNILNKTC